MDLSLPAGGLLLLILSLFGIAYGATGIRRLLQRGSTFDNTGSEVTKGDAPGLYWLHTVGFLALALASFMVGSSAVAEMFL